MADVIAHTNTHTHTDTGCFLVVAQYVFTVKSGEDGQTMIDLMQEDHRSHNGENLSIGFHVYRVSEGNLITVKSCLRGAWRDRCFPEPFS